MRARSMASLPGQPAADSRESGQFPGISRIPRHCRKKLARADINYDKLEPHATLLHSAETARSLRSEKESEKEKEKQNAPTAVSANDDLFLRVRAKTQQRGES